MLFFLSACQTTTPAHNQGKSEQPDKKQSIALTKIDDVNEISPAINSLLKQAKYQHETGNINSAFSTLERAIRIDPRFPESYYLLGELHYERGNDRQAGSLAQKAISLGASGNVRDKALSLIKKTAI